MIQIKSIKMRDFGRHHLIDDTFGGYVVGLTGPNGRGKSTVLQALQFALTGTIDHPDKLSAFIRRSSGSKPPKAAEVEVTFVADGREGRIIRRITKTTSARKFFWDGAEKPITSEKKVSSLLFEILGVDKKAINSTVFISQGEMTSMFKQKTDRREFYTKLLMLGHLSKIGNIVEAHRSHLASTVQDLGAVRDAADATYREASTFFEACESDLAKLPDRKVTLDSCRKLLGLYGDHATAEDAERKAYQELQAVLAVESAEEFEKWHEGRKGGLAGHLHTFSELGKRRNAHEAATAELRNVETRARTQQEIAQKFIAMHEVEAKLVGLGEGVADPTQQIQKSEEVLEQMQQRDSLKEKLPALKKLAEDRVSALAAAEKSVVLLEKNYESLRDSYRDVEGKLKMCRSIHANLQAEHDDSVCPACGSSEPDHEYLTKCIEDLTAQQEKLTPLGAEAGDKLRAAKDERDCLSREATTADDAAQAAEKEYKKLRVVLCLLNQEKVEKELPALKEQLKSYTIHAAEAARLAAELRERRDATAGLRMPSQDEVDELAARHAKVSQELQENPWTPEDAKAAEHAHEAAKKIRDDISAADKVFTRFEDAKKKRVTAATALQDGIDDLRESDDNPFADVQVALCVREVTDTLSALEFHQKERDEAVGRKEAANESLKAASRKIDELSLRTEEQKVRLKLAKDLERIRDTFRPEGAPMEYLNYKFGKIARLAADYLAESGADFMVTASEEVPLSFEFLRTDRPDEAWMPQNRMSGGQKVRLAVATLRAIHAMIMPEVGLLVLDEPTTHLDEEAKKSMADMLQKIGEEGTLQMIVCDHSPTLIDAFSDTIDIPE